MLYMWVGEVKFKAFQHFCQRCIADAVMSGHSCFRSIFDSRPRSGLRLVCASHCIFPLATAVTQLGPVAEAQ